MGETWWSPNIEGGQPIRSILWGGGYASGYLISGKRWEPSYHRRLSTLSTCENEQFPLHLPLFEGTGLPTLPLVYPSCHRVMGFNTPAARREGSGRNHGSERITSLLDTAPNITGPT